MEGGDDVDTQSAGLCADLRQAAALDLDVDGDRAALGRPVGEPVEDGAQKGDIGGVVQTGPAPLGGGAAGEQHRGGGIGVNTVGGNGLPQPPQALQDPGGSRGSIQRVGGGQGASLLQQVHAQLEDVGAGVDGAAGLGPRLGEARPGQGDSHRGQAAGAGDAAPAPGQRRRAHAGVPSAGPDSGTSDRAMPSRMS